MRRILVIAVAALFLTGCGVQEPSASERYLQAVEPYNAALKTLLTEMYKSEPDLTYTRTLAAQTQEAARVWRSYVDDLKSEHAEYLSMRITLLIDYLGLIAASVSMDELKGYWYPFVDETFIAMDAATQVRRNLSLPDAQVIMPVGAPKDLGTRA